MKYLQLSSLVTLGLVGLGDAYPSIAAHLSEQEQSSSVWSKLKKRTGFDAAAQKIDVSGAHAFVAPGSGDQRGPCPGLNALANHNYLPHNGVATVAQYVEATTSVFGMGVDLATFLSVYGAVMDGNLVSWSMGGPTGLLSTIGGGLLGTPQGISGSHNKYEGDGSPTRGDLYQYGNDYLLQMKQFNELYAAGSAENSYDLDVLTKFRAQRFQESISQNPYFFYGPFSGTIVTPAAYTFIYRFMGNKSAENPEGYLDGDVLKSFFSITGDEGSFTYTPGWERIPENWYTRNAADPYGIVPLTLDSQAANLQYPEFAIPGGNTGTTNSYLGVNPSNLTGGVITAGNLLEGNNALCLAYQASVQFLPDLLEGAVTDVTDSLNKLTAQFDVAIKDLGCSDLASIQKSQFDQYPGYTKLKSSGNYRRR